MALAAENRLRSPADFKKVLGESRKTGGRAGDRLLLIAAIPTTNAVSRIGLSVGKKVGSAVERNRVKRRLREIFREAETAGSEPGVSWDLVVTAQSGTTDASYDELRQSAIRLLEKVKRHRKQRT